MKKTSQLLLLILFGSFVTTICAQTKTFKDGKVKTNNYFEELPFEFEKNKIIIPVEIQGTIYRFLLDTGAPNIISKEVQKAIEPRSVVTLSTSDANNLKQDLDIVTLESLKLGSVEFQNFSALVFDLNGSDIFKCFGIDGFIGSNLLRHTIIQINAEQKKLILTDNIKRLNLNKNQSKKIKLIGDQSSPYVWINIIGQDKGKEMILIDTGMGNLYDLSEDNYNIFKTKNIYNEIGKSIGASSLSLFGEVPIDSQTRVHLPKLVINNFEINNTITHTTKGDHSRIGAELLNHGVMTIDYKNKRLYFNPYKTSLNLEGDFGFTQTLKNNKLVIGYVWDQDLKTKIEYGDEILEVNGIEVITANFCDHVTKKSVLKTLNAVTLKVLKNDGNVLNLKLEKKPLSSIFDNFNIN
ncbi:retropepsin-like aspartic protease [Psychroserpens ponticola]|uniref:Retropepsin-like aspartic protease n=1 Tax=Psychroserpens ponticola TaxID=2932268 RepID=A0ABY7S1K5_9FLAO|nr:retropepsin-like aspartic protease [Psychroserpens ponticola]WCO03278.1 retropepsin-like aspartic protease [Psychroserpens ponticola]